MRHVAVWLLCCTNNPLLSLCLQLYDVATTHGAAERRDEALKDVAESVTDADETGRSCGARARRQAPREYVESK